VKKRVWPSQVTSSSNKSGHAGNNRVVMGNIELLSQQARKDDGEVLLYFITFKRFT
jgi:ribosomal protein L3